MSVSNHFPDDSSRPFNALLPYAGCRELLVSMSGGVVATWHVVVSALFQPGLSLVLDWALRRVC